MPATEPADATDAQPRAAEVAAVSAEGSVADGHQPSLWGRFHVPEWRRYVALAELLVIAAVVGAAIVTALVVPRLPSDQLLSPWVAAGFLLLNLLPAMALLVLIGRRIALRRAAQGGGQGRLLSRLVALFSLTSAAPTLVIVVLASFLFQSGMEIWFSDRSRGMFENALSVAQNFFETERRDVGANALAMATDLRGQLTRTPMNSPDFYDYYVQQVVVRELSESAIVELGRDGIVRTPVLIDPDNRAADTRVPPDAIRRLLAGEQIVSRQAADRVDAIVRLSPDRPVFLYAARGALVFGVESVSRAQSVFSAYQTLYSRSRALQYRFLLTLYAGSLILIGLVIAVAILAADRIVRPIEDLAGAAQRIARGDLEARVRSPAGRPDEIALLATAFNQMTEQLGEQTRALLFANEQIENRRAFIEAVLSGVSSGVVSLDPEQRIRLVNASAADMMRRPPDDLIDRPLADAVPDLVRALDDVTDRGIVDVVIDGEAHTWAITVSEDESGQVVTFEDMTQQLSDQRRAAWSDVARRVAHEIKNPLTPIQLAAERLQRRFASRQGDDEATFRQLTTTIVRQVGDLRRMVDEFSSFARMPKPVFRADNLSEILRQAMFLHEVARPAIRFDSDVPEQPVALVCDRRLLGQAFSNIIKNACEAIDRAGHDHGVISAAVSVDEDSIELRIADNGTGIAADRDRILEPYVTTREGGTGLGLAIVKKIIEEHDGTLSFADRDGGGTEILIRFWPARLAGLDAGDRTGAADTASDRN